MGIEEEFEEFKKIYETGIKPNIINKKYFFAGIALENLIMGIEIVEPETGIIKQYHNGRRFYAAAKVLGKRLLEENVSERTIKRFEGYLAQLGLAIKSRNKFGSAPPHN